MSRKKVFLERCLQNSQENTCVWYRCVPVNFAKFLRTSFLQNTSGRLLLLLAFQKQPREVFYEKHLFYKTLLDDCFWLLLKWGTASGVWKTSDKYSLSRTTNLRSTVQVYQFFFEQDKLPVYVFIDLYCLLPEAVIRVEVYCKKRCS